MDFMSETRSLYLCFGAKEMPIYLRLQKAKAQPRGAVILPLAGVEKLKRGSRPVLKIS
jgi:hypothetical protein